MKRTQFLLVGLAFASVGAGAACAAEAMTQAPATTTAPVAATAQVPTLDYDPSKSLAPLVQRLQGSVVNIHVEQKVKVPQMAFGFPFMDPRFQQGQNDQYQVRKGQGSGFIISSDGYILTNNHVVADADEVTVVLGDQPSEEQSYKAKVIGVDKRTDVALVKIDTKKKLPFVQLGDSAAMQTGDWVVAIGNPFGLSHTVTAGIISAKGRFLGAGPYDDFIQTDASINPGNSGGPLFNLQGQVVGINTAINPYGQNIGFAVPIDMVKPILDELKTTGTVARGWIGVGLQELDTDTAKGLGVSSDAKGVVVGAVYPGMPADKAGLKAGDVVQQMDGTPVESREQHVRAVGMHRPGDQITLDILRNGKHKTLSVKLGERPPEKELAQKQFWQGDGGSTSPQGIGIQVEEKKGFGGFGGSSLVVTQVEDGSPADGRLAAGDTILSVNGQEVESQKDLGKALQQGGNVALFVVDRGGAQVLVSVPLNGGDTSQNDQ